MSWTRAGTISVTNGSAVVFGASTAWAALCRPGDTFIAPGGVLYEVLSVQSNTQLTLASAYLGTTASAQAYAIINTGLLPAELAIGVEAWRAKMAEVISQLYEWQTSVAATVPMKNLGTGVTTQVKPIAGLIADMGLKAPLANPTFSEKVGIGVTPAISPNRLTVLGTGAFSPASDTMANGVGVCVLGQDLAVGNPASARLYMTGGNAAHAGSLELRSGSVVTSSANLFTTTGALGLSMDATGNVHSLGGGLIGYAAGGTVTQATSKSTAVTLNKPTGVITTAASELAAGAMVDFPFHNSLLSSCDGLVVQASHVSGHYQAWAVYSPLAGLVYIRVKNTSAFALSDVVVLSFSIIKGATA